MALPTVDVPTAALAVLQFINAFVPPARREIEFGMNRIHPNQVPTVSDAIDLRRKGLLSEAIFNEYLLRQGWNVDKSTKFWEASRTRLPADALVLLNWRGEITDKQFTSQMFILGYTEETANLFKQSLEFYPSPIDLVNWQAKEVFEPDAIEKYGLDNEFELIEKEAFYKAGMSDEQIRNFWRAHWQHPSLQMIYSMLHRGLLTKEDVYEYYRLVEIPPYWREKLTELSYPPYTRVDTRRMYEMGVLTKEQVMRNYLDLGYDEEKATKMTEFTTVYSAQKDKDLTRSQIEKAYEYGIITQESTIELLIKLGYDQEESLFILGIKAYSIMQDELDDKVATIKTRFRRGLITQEIAISELDKLEISPIFRDKTVAEILRVKQTEFQLPNKTDLAKMYQGKIIDKKQFNDYMERIGFQTDEINLYLELFKL